MIIINFFKQGFLNLYYVYKRFQMKRQTKKLLQTMKKRQEKLFAKVGQALYNNHNTPLSAPEWEELSQDIQRHQKALEKLKKRLQNIKDIHPPNILG